MKSHDFPVPKAFQQQEMGTEGRKVLQQDLVGATECCVKTTSCLAVKAHQYVVYNVPVYEHIFTFLVCIHRKYENTV